MGRIPPPPAPRRTHDPRTQGARQYAERVLLHQVEAHASAVQNGSGAIAKQALEWATDWAHVVNTLWEMERRS